MKDAEACRQAAGSARFMQGPASLLSHATRFAVLMTYVANVDSDLGSENVQKISVWRIHVAYHNHMWS